MLCFGMDITWNLLSHIFLFYLLSFYYWFITCPVRPPHFMHIIQENYLRPHIWLKWYLVKWIWLSLFFPLSLIWCSNILQQKWIKMLHWTILFPLSLRHFSWEKGGKCNHPCLQVCRVFFPLTNMGNHVCCEK